MKEEMIDAALKHYPDLVHDLLRIASIQVAIHVMMCAEGSESFGDRKVVAIFLYTILGVLFYHLIAKVMLRESCKSGVIGKSDSSTGDNKSQVCNE